MIKAYNVFAEFVKDLGEDFSIDAVNESGVAFYYNPRVDLKFGLAVAPMFGIEEGHVGFVVTKNSRPYLDNNCYRLEDPELLDHIKARICYWLSSESPGPISEHETKRLLSRVR